MKGGAKLLSLLDGTGAVGGGGGAGASRGTGVFGFFGERL